MPAIIKGTAFSDDDLQRLSATNPGWQFERADDGALLVSPAVTPGGSKSGEAFAQRYAFAKRTGGKAYDSQTGFKTPGGGVVSPEASWVSPVRILAYQNDDGYWQMMPDIVIEVASKTGDWALVKKKIDKYVEDGGRLRDRDRSARREIYERGVCPATLLLDTGAFIDA